MRGMLTGLVGALLLPPPSNAFSRLSADPSAGGGGVGRAIRLVGTFGEKKFQGAGRVLPKLGGGGRREGGRREGGGAPR